MNGVVFQISAMMITMMAWIWLVSGAALLKAADR